MTKEVKDTEVKKVEVKEIKAIKSEKFLPARIHLKQFLSSHPELDQIRIAGFTVFVGKLWMRIGEWENKYKEYFKDEGSVSDGKK